MHPTPPLFAILVFTLSLGGGAANGDPRDPLEPMNRAIHAFNEGFDRALLKPAAQAYETVMPGFAQTGVRNFFANLDDLTVLANDVLQLKLEQGSRDFMRLAVNSTFGLFGLLDVAGEMGLQKHNEDFGQTLGRWGVGTGPYLVLPFLGPADFRDTAGLLIDNAYTDVVLNYNEVSRRNPVLALRTVSRRADLLDAKRAIDAAALDEYEFNRDLYLARRMGLVHDGNPPRDAE